MGGFTSEEVEKKLLEAAPKRASPGKHHWDLCDYNVPLCLLMEVDGTSTISRHEMGLLKTNTNLFHFATYCSYHEISAGERPLGILSSEVRGAAEIMITNSSK